MNTAPHALRRLTRVGFAAELLFTAGGTPGSLLYRRRHSDTRDVVLVRSPRSALAYSTDHRVDPDTPFHIGQNHTLWHREGELAAVVQSLLADGAR